MSRSALLDSEFTFRATDFIPADFLIRRTDMGTWDRMSDFAKSTIVGDLPPTEEVVRLPSDGTKVHWLGWIVLAGAMSVVAAVVVSCGYS